MPPAAALAVPAVIGAAGQASGGKKAGNAAKNAANQQFQMQQQVLDFGKSLANTGLGAWNLSSDYWKKLLSGDPNQIAQATGPTADIIRGQGQATGQQLAATMPMGGEANAAQAQNLLQQSNNMARLYAGVQPTAAQALGQLSSIPFGAGTSVMGQGAPNVGSGLKFNTHAADQASQAKGGLGTGLGTLLGSRSAGKSSGGGNNAGKKGGTGSSGASTGPLNYPGSPGV